MLYTYLTTFWHMRHPIFGARMLFTREDEGGWHEPFHKMAAWA
jgi:hypothetical protein